MGQKPVVAEPGRVGNPFIYNAPVRSTDFFNREEVIDKLLRETVTGKSQGNVWITGERQVGKTSLLKYIQSKYEEYDKKIRLYPEEDYFNVAFIYLNVQDTKNRNDFYKNLRQSLKNHFNFKIKYTDNAYKNYIHALEHLYSKEKYYIVLLLDEFDTFIEHLAADEPKAATAFLAELNKLVQGISEIKNEPKIFSCIFAANQTIEELLKENEIDRRGSGLVVERMELDWFTRERVEQLAQHYLTDNLIQFSSEDIDFCFKMTQGYPYFVQKLFSIIYEQKSRDPGSKSDLSKVGEDYENAFRETVNGWALAKMPGRTKTKLNDLYTKMIQYLPLYGSSPFAEEPDRKKRSALQGQNVLYIAKVKLENIQGFNSVSADFAIEDGDPLMFSLLLGDNSAGKTTFLRCLALGLCDKNSAAALLGDFQGKFIRNGQKQGTINIELNLPGNGKYRITTIVKRSKDSEDLEKEYTYIPAKGKPVKIPLEDFPWDDLFVCGYGAGRVLGKESKKYEQYKIKDAVGTLFHYDQPMQDPELSLRRVVSEARYDAVTLKEFGTEQEILHRFQELIKNLFMFTGKERIELAGRGIEVVNAEGRSVLQSHGDGYKNTSAWVLDLITWNMLAGRELKPDAMTGIVLIDEIEQHLHPKWQRYIIQLLRKEFPGIQFVAATHSPLCVSGITDLDEDKYRVLRFHKTADESVDLIPVTSLRGLRADQLLTSEAFDLPTTRNPDTAKKLERFAELYLLESRTEQEEKEFRELGGLLEKNLPGSAEDAEARLMQERLKNMLEDMEKLTTTKWKKHD